MLKFNNVPPKEAGDVEFGKSAKEELDLINTPGRSGDESMRIISRIGSSTARELLDNMEDPTLTDVVGLAEGFIKSSEYFSTNHYRIRQFLNGVVDETVKTMYTRENEPPVPGVD